MINPNYFHSVVKEELEERLKVKEIILVPPRADKISRSSPEQNYIGGVQSLAPDVIITGGYERFVLKDCKFEGLHDTVVVGVEYQIRLDSSDFDQSSRLANAVPRGVILYEGWNESRIHTLEIAQAFVDLENRKISYTGFNTYAQIIMPRFPSIEGLDFRKGVSKFFEMISQKK